MIEIYTLIHEVEWPAQRLRGGAGYGYITVLREKSLVIDYKTLIDTPVGAQNWDNKRVSQHERESHPHILCDDKP